MKKRIIIMALSLLAVPSTGQITKGLRIRTKLRGLVQRYGPTKLKALIWDQEYETGHWRGLENIPDDPVYSHLEKHARGGDILDLGCGPGAVGNHLNSASYRSYLGVDISEVAVRKAIRKNTTTGRSGKNQFLAADISAYETHKKFDVILFGDSIYYFSVARAAELLHRYSDNLKSDGVFLVRMFVTSKRAKAILDHIETRFDVRDSSTYLNYTVRVIAFRPKAAPSGAA